MLFKRKVIFDSNSLMKEIHESKRLKRSAMFVIGTVLLALSFNLFIKPYHLISGVSGISIMALELFGIEPFIIILIGNVILLVASLAFLGKENTKAALIGSLLYPALVKLTEPISNYIDLGDTELIVMVVFGALISGLGTGLIFKNNFSSGGSDVLKQIFTTYGKMPYSKANIYSEGLIMFCGGLVFGWPAFIYSIIYLVISGVVSDRVIMGISEYKTLEIITTKEEEIKQFIMQSLNHGITEIDVKGGYTNDRKKILLCAIPTREYFLTTEAIKKIDSEAFVIAIDTYEIQGRE